MFESGIETTMIGLDVTHPALVTDADADDLRRTGRVGRVAAELLDFYRRWHRASYPDLGGVAAARPRRRRAPDRPDPRRDEARAHRRRLRLGAGPGQDERRLARQPPDGKPPNAVVGLGDRQPRASSSSSSHRIASLG